MTFKAQVEVVAQEPDDSTSTVYYTLTRLGLHQLFLDIQNQISVDFGNNSPSPLTSLTIIISRTPAP